jgi:hypothetical protein
VSLPESVLEGHDWKVGFVTNLYKSPNTNQIQQFMIQEDKVVETKKVVVHTFTVGDVDDPDLYAADPLYQWQNTEAGSWVMANAADTPEWHRHFDISGYGHKYAVTAVFELKKLTEYFLRFGKPTG